MLRAWTPGTIADRVRAAFAGDPASFASALAIDALGLVAAIAAIVLAAIVIASLLLGRLGPITPELAHGLALPQPPVRVRVGVGLGALMFVLLVFELRSRIAGAARAADASADGLVALWHGSTLALATSLGIAMIAVGVLEAWWARSDRLELLRPTPEQARDEARARGGRRR